MFYLFALILAIVIAIIFRSLTQDFSSWPTIKERWFRWGIDNKMLFSNDKLQDGRELARLDGDYSGCLVTLGTAEGRPPKSLIEVTYPMELNAHLSTYPQSVFDRITEILNDADSQLDEELERPVVAYEETVGMRQKRLNPKLLEQLFELRRQSRLIGRFTVTTSQLKYEQRRLLSDPTPLSPLLDEMAFTVNVINENSEHLLVN